MQLRPIVQRGQMLAELTWTEAERALTPETIVVIPLGAGSKEHGPHLELRNDAILAEYFTRRVLAAADVVIAPLVNTHFYPAFVEYPGSISLSFETARALIVDLVRSPAWPSAQALLRAEHGRVHDAPAGRLGRGAGPGRRPCTPTRTCSRPSARWKRKCPSNRAAPTPTRLRPR